jgi:hypothetical protein
MDRRQVLITTVASLVASSARADDAKALADKLVAATGGPAAWRAARGLEIRATHFEAQLPTPYANALFIALETPAMRFEGRSETMNRVRAVVGGNGWRVSERNPLGPMTPEQVRSDLDWWEAHPYRNIRRLAVADPALTPRLAADGRLELIRPDRRRLLWYRLNAAGEPTSFGVGDSEVGTVLGPLAPALEGGVRLPQWSGRADGSFRGSDQRARVFPHPPNVDFEKP